MFLRRVVAISCCASILAGCSQPSGRRGVDTGETLVSPAAASRSPAGDKADETPHGPLDPSGELRGIKNPN